MSRRRRLYSSTKTRSSSISRSTESRRKGRLSRWIQLRKCPSPRLLGPLFFSNKQNNHEIRNYVKIFRTVYIFLYLFIYFPSDKTANYGLRKRVRATPRTSYGPERLVYPEDPALKSLVHVAAPFSGEMTSEDPSGGWMGAGGWVQRPREGAAGVTVVTSEAHLKRYGAVTVVMI